jgi:tetratricopeptide (TPR) repeat protein
MVELVELNRVISAEDAGPSDVRKVTVRESVTGSTIISGDGNTVTIIHQHSRVEPEREEPSQSPSELPPSPYKGLEAFYEEDADRFFGRGAVVDTLWRRLRDLQTPPLPGEAAPARLLAIIGPSGSGKSSVARAGLVPELARRPIPGLTNPHVAVVVPHNEPIEALATVLARLATNDPAPVAKSREFADELRRINEGKVPDGLRRIANILPGADRHPLILLVDQFEEVFTGAPEAERSLFIQMLLDAALDRSGRISIVLTLRSDFLSATARYPTLDAAIAGCSELVPAMSEAELKEAILLPAVRATERLGIPNPLDQGTVELLVEETIGRAGALPLLEFALHRIWEGLAQGTPGADTLRKLGGVGGALAAEADRLADDLAKSGKEDLVRRAFLAMVQLGEGVEDTRRRAKLSEVVAAGETPDEVVTILQRFAHPGERLVTFASDGGEATLEVTHEQLIARWPKLQGWLREWRDDERFRRRLAAAAKDWREGQGGLWGPTELELLRRWRERPGQAATPEQQDFVDASEAALRKQQQHARRAARLTRIAAVVFAILALAATGAGTFAWREEQRAQRSLDAAKTAVNVLVVDIAHGLRNVEGVRISLIRTVLERIQDTVEWLTRFAPDNLALWHLYLETLDEFATTYETAGDIVRARESAMTALAKGRELAEHNPDDPVWRRDVSVTLNRLGSVDLKGGDTAAALSRYEEALGIMRRLAERDPSNATWQRDLAISINGVGDVKAQRGEARGALAAYDEGLTIMRGLQAHDPTNLDLQREIAVRLNATGDMKLSLGDAAAATADHEEGLTICRALVKINPDNTQWQRDVFFSVVKIGDLKAQAGNLAEASRAYGEGVAIVRRLAALDPSNPLLLLDIAQGLSKLGDIKLDDADRNARVALYEEALEIMRGLAQRDLYNSAWQRELSVSLNKIGDVKLLRGDADGAGAAYAEALTIAGRLTERDPQNFLWRRDLALGLNKIGDVRLRTGDANGAAANYEQALANLRGLSERDASNTLWLRDINVTLNKLGDAKLQTGDMNAAAASYDEALRIVRRLVERDPRSGQWQWDFWFTLYNVGSAKLSLGDTAAAGLAYKEALPIIRHLADADPGSTERQTDLVANLYRLAIVGEEADRQRALRDASAILARLRDENRLTPDKIGWPDLFREMLNPHGG